MTLIPINKEYLILGFSKKVIKNAKQQKAKQMKKTGKKPSLKYNLYFLKVMNFNPIK